MSKKTGKTFFTMVLSLVLLLSLSVSVFAASYQKYTPIDNSDAKLDGDILTVTEDSHHFYIWGQAVMFQDAGVTVILPNNESTFVDVQFDGNLYKGISEVRVVDNPKKKGKLTLEQGSMVITGITDSSQETLVKKAVAKQPKNLQELEDALTGVSASLATTGKYLVGSGGLMSDIEGMAVSNNSIFTDMEFVGIETALVEKEAKIRESMIPTPTPKPEPTPTPTPTPNPGGGCLAAGTLITMADGSKKPIEDIEYGDMLQTFDHETGRISSSKVVDIWELKDLNGVFRLDFEDSVSVTVVDEHGFYEKESNKYAFLNSENVKNYVGHSFYNAENDKWLKLIGYEIYDGTADAYSICTSKQFNTISNGMLNITDGYMVILANLFEFDENMKIDQEKKAADIAKWGTISREEMPGCSAADYYDFNMMYLPVAVGKGYTTWDMIAERNRIFAE